MAKAKGATEKGAKVKGAKAKGAEAKTAKAKAEAPQEPPFEDTSLALCVVESLVDQGLVSTSIMIPELAPQDDDDDDDLDDDDDDDDDDLDDESESWRDRLDTNQDEAIAALLALLAKHRSKLPQLRKVQGVLLHIAEDYEPDIYSLRGIEACTGLEEIDIWSRDPKLDLSPLVALPKLRVVDLGAAFGLRNYEPLYELRSLRRVNGPIDPRVAAELRSRGIEVKDGND